MIPISDGNRWKDYSFTGSVKENPIKHMAGANAFPWKTKLNCARPTIS